MEKPTEVITNKMTMLFKDLCIMWKAKYAWLNDVKHKLPEKWK